VSSLNSSPKARTLKFSLTTCASANSGKKMNSTNVIPLQKRKDIKTVIALVSKLLNKTINEGMIFKNQLN
jgi:hypothetical protein